MPSKKILPILIACLIVLVAIIVAIFYNPSSAPKTVGLEKITPQDLVAITGQTTDVDTDHDGLKDWEEVIWKTDPNKADTDGDGVSDGEEVIEGRDPTVKGAGTSTGANSFSAVTGKTTSDSAPLTATDKLSREIFTEYMTYKQAGVPINADTSQAVANKVLSESAQLRPEAKVYTNADIIVEPNSNDGDLFTYGNAVGDTILKYSTGTTSNESQIIADAMTSDDEKKLSALDPIISGYQKATAALLKIPAPTQLKAIHLEVINSMSAVTADIITFKKIFSDPIVGIGGIKYYKDDVDRMFKAIQTLSNSLTGAGITYNQDEGGFIITQTVK